MPSAARLLCASHKSPSAGCTYTHFFVFSLSLSQHSRFFISARDQGHFTRTPKRDSLEGGTQTQQEGGDSNASMPSPLLHHRCPCYFDAKVSKPAAKRDSLLAAGLFLPGIMSDSFPDLDDDGISAFVLCRHLRGRSTSVSIFSVTSVAEKRPTAFLRDGPRGKWRTATSAIARRVPSQHAHSSRLHPFIFGVIARSCSSGLSDSSPHFRLRCPLLVSAWRLRHALVYVYSSRPPARRIRWTEDSRPRNPVGSCCRRSRQHFYYIALRDKFIDLILTRQPCALRGRRTKDLAGGGIRLDS